MKTLVLKSSNEEYKIPATGLHNAVCIGIAFLGNMETKYGPKEKVAIIFELETGEIMATEQTPTFGSKSNLRKLLQSWRGKPFTEEELNDGFELMSILGSSCQLNVTHNEQNERVYANIDTILQKVKTIEPSVVPYGFSVLDETAENFEQLPLYLQMRVMKSYSIPANSRLVTLSDESNTIPASAKFAQEVFSNSASADKMAPAIKKTVNDLDF